MLKTSNVSSKTIKTPGKQGESNSWSFRIAGSDETLKVTNIKDDQFLENIKKGRYRLTNADKLHIEVQEKQKIQGNKESMSCEIIQVIEYIVSQPGRLGYVNSQVAW